MKKVAIIVSVIALALALAAPSFAQDPNLDQGGVNLQRDAGDNLSGGVVVGDDTPDCATPDAVLESGLCEPGSGLNENPATLKDVPAPSASASASAPAPAVQYQYSASAAPEQDIPLPDTGGFNLPLFIGVVLVIGGVIVGSRLYLRNR